MQKKQILKFVLLPQILPRVRDLTASGFAYIAFFMALVFRMIRLLPEGHPYLLQENFAQYSVHHVVSQAWRNLKHDRQHIDQIIVFYTILFGIVMLAGQFLVLLSSLISGAAMAASTTGVVDPSIFQFFKTKAPTQDIAFIMLDRVFGLPHLFGSCVEQNIACLPRGDGGRVGALGDGAFPSAYHTALHSIFHFYSKGLLIVAAIIFLYYMVVVVVETAQTGTPFGKRFNTVWAPIRIVFGIGLLIPVAYGMNSGQYITLYAAKLGSSFATNGWITFTNTLYNANIKDPLYGSNKFLVEPSKMITEPDAPRVKSFVAFTQIAHTCKVAQERIYGDKKQIKAYAVRPTQNTQSLGAQDYLLLTDPQYDPQSGKASAASISTFKDFEELLAFTGQKNNIHIVFGHLDPNSKYMGKIVPECGELSLKMNTLDFNKHKGAKVILNGYYNMIISMWTDPFTHFNAMNVVNRYYPLADFDKNKGFPLQYHNAARECFVNLYQDYLQGVPQSVQCQYELQNFDHYDAENKPIYKTPEKQSMSYGPFPGLFKQAMKANLINDLPDVQINGWAGAATWYNKISELNGTFIKAAYNLPQPDAYPLIMKKIAEERANHDAAGSAAEQFTPTNFKNEPSKVQNHELQVAKMLNEVYQSWLTQGKQEETGNSIKDFVARLFGVNGMLDIRKNQDKHPIARLTAIGQALIESTIVDVFGSFVLAGVSGLGNLSGQGQIMAFGGAGITVAGILVTIAGMGLGAGFTLAYIVPFLPFLYFFFAAARWVKGLFEAMVGVPLWALAHIRIDGDGLPGSAAMGGYFLIFEIFLRPILTIFGLIAGITIFAAQMDILNLIWDSVTGGIFGAQDSGGVSNAATGAAQTISNVANIKNTADLEASLANLGNGIDNFFYLILFALISYMMAMASFKMIDMIPNNILRWMGNSVQTFGAGAEDPAQNMIGYATLGGSMIGNTLGNSLQSVYRAGGETTTSLGQINAKKAAQPPKQEGDGG